MAINVLLVDDHPVVREGICNLLRNSPGIEVIGSVSSGEEALYLIKQQPPDVIILDLEMPGISGIDVVRQVKEQGLPCHILVLSAHDDKVYIQEVFALGVDGYLTKEEALEDIVEAVRGVSRGEKGWVSRRVAAHMSSVMMNNVDKTRDLTNREVEVIRLVVGGKTNREIALFLGISEKTVEKHLDGIFTKLGVSTRLEAAVRVVKEGWL